MKVMVSGSRSVRILPEAAQDALRKVMTLGAQILVGDCEGVDRAVQDFLSEAGYTNVTVYHIGPRPRHNRGFPTVAVSGTRYEDKDIHMCQEAEYGLAIWDGRSPGTRRNISRVPKIRVIVAESRQQRRERVSQPSARTPGLSQCCRRRRPRCCRCLARLARWSAETS